MRMHRKITSMRLAQWSLLMLLMFVPALPAASQPYHDRPFLQDFARKYPFGDRNFPKWQLFQVAADRNGRIQVRSSKYLLKPGGKYLVRDDLYPFLNDVNIRALGKYRDQFVYLSEGSLFSNAWAGKFWVDHDLEDASAFCLGNDFDFLLASDGLLEYYRDGQAVWKKEWGELLPLEMLWDDREGRFLLLTDDRLYTFDPAAMKLNEVHRGASLTTMTLMKGSLVLGSRHGYYLVDRHTFRQTQSLQERLPWPELTRVRYLHGRLWFGSTRGAFVLREDGQFDYYASKRWLVDDRVVDLAEGPGRSILVLTSRGLSIIDFKPMTLAEKAAYFEKVQRLRHIRYGFQSRANLRIPGDLTTAYMVDSDNDGLWTSMYLAGELYRYAVTRSPEALQNAYEAFEAMERLTEISGIPGFPARTYERDGYQSSDRDPEMPEEQKIWRLTPDGRWRWKSTTSSDESCGHFFVYALFADIVPDKEWRDRAIHQIRIETDHIINHDWYLVTWNGKPTQWGRWNPEYVNSFPINVGDRRLNSTLIIAFLQTAYHFTGDEIYKDKAYELMEQHGYLENILRPASVIGYVEGQPLSDGWNHSDDEMYFLTARALIKYAFTDELRKKFFETVKSHWELERPEKNPLWNFIYAQVGGKEYDLDNSIWWLKEFPLDLVSWNVDNTWRKDIDLLEPNFMRRTTRKVLPPDECPMTLHNSAYEIKGGDGGRREYPPYIYTLPYWLGRYIGAITEEEK